MTLRNLKYLKKKHSDLLIKIIDFFTYVLYKEDQEEIKEEGGRLVKEFDKLIKETSNDFERTAPEDTEVQGRSKR